MRNTLNYLFGVLSKLRTLYIEANKAREARKASEVVRNTMFQKIKELSNLYGLSFSALKNDISRENEVMAQNHFDRMVSTTTIPQNMLKGHKNQEGKKYSATEVPFDEIPPEIMTKWKNTGKGEKLFEAIESANKQIRVLQIDIVSLRSGAGIAGP